MTTEAQKLLHDIRIAVKSIRDINMRSVRMIEKLCAAPPAEGVLALQELVSRGGRGDLDISMTIAALTAALAPDSQLPYITRAELYREAIDIGASEISYLLLEGEGAPAEVILDAPRSIAPRGTPLPLGARKSKARTRDRQTLSHLIHDPNPQVVEIVLSNPDLRETEVLTMASKRPTSEISLQLIAGHPRWSQVRRIRLAITLNEGCSLPLACRLCLDLRDQDLTEIRSSASLLPQLRAHADRLLISRRKSS